jgi:UrcA family protein
MTKITFSIVLAAATLATGIGSAVASTPADRNTVSTTVRFGDLNLANPDGAKALMGRIRRAANQVCEPTPASPSEYADWRNCIADATKDAVTRLNVPTVTAAYAGKHANSVVLAQNSPR